MASESLKHDTAWATAVSILEVFEPLLREEEQQEAFAEVYQRVKAGLECFEIEADRMQRRMVPGKN
jgi:hypothetical protein